MEALYIPLLLADHAFHSCPSRLPRSPSPKDERYVHGQRLPCPPCLAHLSSRVLKFSGTLNVPKVVIGASIIKWLS